MTLSIDWDQIQFSSKLDIKYLDDLEELFFFHPNQSEYEEKLVEINARYGIPEIVQEAGFVGIKVGGISQSFLMHDDNRVLGVIIYTRESKNSIIILHIVVQEGMVLLKGELQAPLPNYLLAKFKDNMANIKGLDYIQVLYRDSCKIKIN